MVKISRRAAAGALLAAALTVVTAGGLLPALPVPHSGVAARADVAPDGTRPNVVLILTDDMRADELRFLPAVRRLQRSGVTFTRALSPDSLCCPARATLLTGKLAHHHLTVGNSVETHGGYPVFAAHNDLHHLLPHWLGERGYRTAWVGKYLNELTAPRHFVQPDWTYFAPSVRHVYDYWRNTFAVNGHPRSGSGYREVFTRRLLLSLVTAWSPGPQPFFIVDSTLAPHESRDAGSSLLPRTQRSHATLHPGRLRVSPAVGELDLSDKPRWLQEAAASQGDPPAYPDALEVKRVGALMSVNRTVHDLIETLREQHELRDTVVIFTSDNGFMLQEHGVGSKNKAYDESLHVPLVVRGPGFRGRVRADQTVSLADVTATVLRLAGDVRRHGGDGVALQDVLAAPRSFDARPVLIEGSAALYPHRATLPTDSIGRFYSGAVWGPYSLVRYETGDWEFYDRSSDPWQLDNTYTANPPPGSPQDLLRNWYLAHVDCRGRACNARVDAAVG
jgi:N-acetylglucosamine-6-sulfatase